MTEKPYQQRFQVSFKAFFIGCARPIFESPVDMLLKYLYK